MNKLAKGFLKAGLVSSSIILGITLVASEITSANRIAISNQLKQPTFKIEQIETEDGAEPVDNVYFKSNYANLSDLVNAGKKLAEQIEAEGAVLLENNGALPLAKGTKVSLFGTASEACSYGGRGSSQAEKPLPPTDVTAGFNEAGLKVNPTLSKWYEDKCKAEFSNSTGDGYLLKTIYEYSFDSVKKSDKFMDNLAEYDTAVYVLSRNGSENMDLRPKATLSGNEDEISREKSQKRTLELTTNEKGILTNLAELKKQGKIKKIIVVLNSTNQIEQNQFLDEYGIDAMIWAGHFGLRGAAAIGKLVTGETPFNGHLPDTFYYEHNDNPVMLNFPFKVYGNTADFPEFKNELSGGKYNSYYAYQEGIYVGYRYSETRYTDVVEGRENAGEWKYDDVIYKPFGYGQSYTTFDWSDFKVSKTEEGNFNVAVKVTNTGKVAARDAVQIYIQKPYTQWDIERGIEKAAVELVGYGKTKVLNPNESEVVNVEVNREVVKTYDRNDAKTYVVTPGTYLLTAGHDAHDAANNFLASKGYTTANGMTANGNANFVSKFDLEYNATSYSLSRATGKKIENLFEEADINHYHGREDKAKGIENSLEFLSRSNWTKKLTSELKVTTEMVKDLKRQLDSKYLKDLQDPNDKYPTYGVEEETHAINLISMLKDEAGNEIAYDNDELWDKFLDQLTWDEMVELLRIGGRCTNGLPSIGKPYTNDHNGPTGVAVAYNTFDGIAKKEHADDPLAATTPVYYPSIPVLAASFDTELAADYGDMLGEDALWAGYAGLYGIGLNTHRSPYAGRQFEYWSEDPLLAGTQAAHQVKALQSHGCNAYIKHFALNDQESQRSNVHIWSNEQALREISLRPFELAVIDGGAMNAMASFTRIGAEMCPGSHALLTDFLRGELGMRGIVVTDMYIIGYKDAMFPALIAAGCDIPDGQLPASVFEEFKEGYPTLANQMRESVKRICYSTLKSNAMNGFDVNTRVIPITPPWEKGVIALEVVASVYFAGMVIWGAVELALALKKKYLIKK